MWWVSRSADGWRKAGAVWHLHRNGVWVAVVWRTLEGWQWHAFGGVQPTVATEAEAKAAAERACG